MQLQVLPFVVATIATSSAANADVCDFRLSELIGNSGTAAVEVGAAATVAAGVGMKVAGVYTLTHSVTGLTMLGSTAAGSSAAGTVGIIAGTGGTLGTIGAILMAPVTITVAAVTGAAIGLSEGVCYFYDDRITDYDSVLAVMEKVAADADPAYFKLVKPLGTDAMAFILIHDAEGNSVRYDVENLYIVNGLLLNRDWFLNTRIGNIGFYRTFLD